VVSKIVGVLPHRGRRRRVPLPGARVDRRVSHPIPLTVHDVVADLHVLEHLGQRQQRGAGDSRRGEPGTEEKRPPSELKLALSRDDAGDVRAVAVAQVGAHGIANAVKLAGKGTEPAAKSAVGKRLVSR